MFSKCRKKLKGDPLGFINIHSVGKLQNKLKGDPLGKFFFRKKSQSRKYSKGVAFGLIEFLRWCKNTLQAF